MKVELIKKDGTVITLNDVGAITTGPKSFTVVYLDGTKEEFLNEEYSSMREIVERSF